MIDTLIVVKSNQYGLTRDAALLASALAGAGVKAEVAGISDRPLLDRLFGRRRARRIIHLERVFPQWISAAEINVLVPNQERFPRRQLGRLRKVDAILAKTQEACSAFAGRGVPVDISASPRRTASIRTCRRTGTACCILPAAVR
jgi:hypothetical protein